MENFNENLVEYTEKITGNPMRKVYRVQGIIMFCVALSLLVMRLIVSYINIKSEILLDAVFTIPLQIGLLVIMPFLIYTFALKMKPRQIFAFSNFKKTKWFNIPLALLIGLLMYFVTIGISAVWQTILMMFGYTHSMSSPLPEVFNPALLVSSLVLTAVLPGICEEFCNRGGFLTTMRASLPLVTTIVVIGISFGLFHQHITQVFYTMFFGALAALLTIKLKSIWPAIVVHFTNNAIAVLSDYCYSYNWIGGGISAFVNYLAENPLLLMLSFFLAGAALIGVIVLTLKLNGAMPSKKTNPKPQSLAMGGNMADALNPNGGTQYNANGVVAAKKPEVLFKPTMRDNAFYIGAIVIAALTTIFAFLFGFVV